MTLESENQWYWCLCQNCSSRAWHSYSWGAVLRKQDPPCVMSCQGSSDKSNSVFFNCLVLSWFLFVAVFLFSLLFGFFLEHFCLRNISDLPSFPFLIVFVWWTTRNMHHWKCRNSEFLVVKSGSWVVSQDLSKITVSWLKLSSITVVNRLTSILNY